MHTGLRSATGTNLPRLVRRCNSMLSQLERSRDSGIQRRRRCAAARKRAQQERSQRATAWRGGHDDASPLIPYTSKTSKVLGAFHWSSLTVIVHAFTPPAPAAGDDHVVLRGPSSARESCFPGVFQTSSHSSSFISSVKLQFALFSPQSRSLALMFWTKEPPEHHR